MNPTLLILAAGMGSRYGGLKQVDPVGPSGETLMDYAVYDALRGGFDRVVFVIRRDFEAEFRARIGRKYEGRMAVDYAFQAPDDLPPGFSVPAERTKPWGTAHAVRAARGLIRAPFAMINADDFYGRDAFASLGAFLRDSRPSADKCLHFAMVGYRLNQTLSEHGTVARGICSVSPAGILQHVQEMTRILPVAGGVENRENEVAPVCLTGQETVSMNMWGFTRELMGALESLFPTWLQANAASLKAEWYIPFVVNELVQQGRADVRVLPTESQWFGVTYREDRPRSAAAILTLIEAGVYPANLWG
ncbi:MAG: sugar phosphate nucleotidyltransferase [bacterium]